MAPEAHRAAHRLPEEPNNTRRNILIAAAAGVAAAGLAGARLTHVLGWGESEPAPHSDPADTGVNPSEAAPSAEPDPAIPPEFVKGKEVDTIGKGTWKFMAGTKPGAKGLDVSILGLSLRPEIGTDTYAKASEAIPLTALNTYGTHLKTGDSDFGILTRLSAIDGEEASVTFNAAPDLIFDERVERAPRVQVTASGNTLVVTVWNEGGEDAPEPQKIELKDTDGQAEFWVKQEGNQVVVGSGDQHVAFDADLFKKSGNVWFGFDGSKGATFSVDELKAYPIGDNSEVTTVDTSTVKLGKPVASGFQSIAHQHRPDVTIGTTTADLGPIAQYPQLAEIVGANAGSIKPERIGKMQNLLPGGPDKDGNIRDEDFNWAELDAFVDLAERNGKKVHMHTLIFGEAMSSATEDFLKNVADGKIPREAAKNFMESYINKVVGRYKDRVKEWDVVNEPLEDTEKFDKDAGRIYRKNAWFNAFGGTEYVRVACEAAKRAGAETVIVNDNGMETDDDRAQAMLDLTAELRNQGYVDGIGFQAHLDSGEDSDIDSWSEDGVVQESYVFDDMTTRFNQFKGFKVYISEMSIDSDNAHEQAVVSHGMMRAAMHAENVKGVEWWGLATGPFYMTSENGQNGNDAPWDWKNNQPVQKQTVGAIQQGLRA
jgi:endo-1,4-beta-xylanase